MSADGGTLPLTDHAGEILGASTALHGRTQCEYRKSARPHTVGRFSLIAR